MSKFIISIIVYLSFLGYLILPAGLKAQLSKPIISVSDVNWGWFTLNMSDYSQFPQNTRWLINEGADTVLDPRWSNCNGIIYPYTADRLDLVNKQILGCKPNTTYTARVSYNNGIEWSPFSEQIEFATLSEPPMNVTDTFFVILWGHSLIHLGDLCDIKTTIRLGEDDYFVRDNIAHMLQTELKRLTNINFKIINRGQFGSLQYRWFRDDSLHKAYLPGGVYENTNKYKYALFFFGSNDCNANYPSPKYAEDIRWILNFLTEKNVKVMFNSIHHTTKSTYANQDSQIVYRNTWDLVMSEYSNNPNVMRGMDFYNLFMDTIRYIWNDGIHCNLSEGMPQIVRQLAPMVQELVGIKKIENSVHDNFVLYQNYPNPFNPSTKILFGVAKPSIEKYTGIGIPVTVNVFDMLGRKITTLINSKFEPGTYEITFDGRGLSAGIYFYQLRSGNFSTTKKLVLLK